MSEALAFLPKGHHVLQPILLAVFFVNAPITRADIVTFYFEGEITNFDTPLKWTFSEGESFTGAYTFDSNVPASPPPFNGNAEFPNSISHMLFNTERFQATAISGIIKQNRVIQQHVPFDGNYSVNFDSISGQSGGLSPIKLELDWKYTFLDVPHTWPRTTIPSGTIIHPGFSSFFLNNEPNGTFSLSFLGSDEQLSTVTGNLDYVSRVSIIPSTIVPTNKWIQIGLSTAPPAGSTVEDIIGDDISAPYGTDWVVFSYETSTNTYQELRLTDAMLPGVGYWFLQTTGKPISIDMPNGSTNIHLIHSFFGPVSSYECYSPNACYEIPLDANVSNTQWQMISHPSRLSENINQVTFLTTATGSDCLRGCSLSEASDKGLVMDTRYHFNGTSYEYITHGGSESFDPWEGAWIAVLPAAYGQSPKLFIEFSEYDGY